jgi:threonine synthase
VSIDDRLEAVASRMVCAACGAEAPDPPSADYPFRCPRARPGDGVDHVLTRVLDPRLLAFPQDDEPNPFVKFRGLLHSYHLARGRGMADGAYVDLVCRLDEQVARIDGHGFNATPFAREAGLSERLGQAGGIWVKDETGNVSGSHKARHLMGLMIYLQAVEHLGLAEHPRAPLAIASCGNAALAAAVVARAAGRELRVFIPPDASPSVVHRLEGLGARLTVCPRRPGELGDPCYLRFREAEREGALPFCCQGPANGLTIEGGETLGYEMLASPVAPPLDRVVVQVGGGALFSSLIQAFVEGVALGVCARLPRFHAVQTQGAYPLKRAYDRLVARIIRALGITAPESDAARADLLAERFHGAVVERELRYAATHRHEFMWPWESEPHSVAHGILDDETYDWHVGVRGMLQSGGYPVVVDEPTLREACTLAHGSTRIRPDHTGAAGLAGLLRLGRDGVVGPYERVAVIFSGAERDAERRV